MFRYLNIKTHGNKNNLQLPSCGSNINESRGDVEYEVVTLDLSELRGENIPIQISPYQLLKTKVF